MKMISLIAVLIFFAALGANAANAEDGGKNCYPVTAKDLIREGAPRFDRFPSKPETIQNKPKVDLKSHPMAGRFRTMLRDGAAKGPNFAGHYAVVGWGCGTSCLQFAVVDLKSGKVIFPGDFSVITWDHFAADDFEKAAAGPYWGLRYQNDSRLLIVVGALNESEERQGAFYYVLEKDKLKKIFSVNIPKNNCPKTTK
jgi:hypothetical protein